MTPLHCGQSESRGGSVIDLFAGPGGWDVGARALGIDPIGLEWDDAACATRRAAGLRTMQCDVAKVDFDAGWRGSRIAGLIASPPCQAWSMAGKGGGRRDKEHVVRCAGELAAGVDTRARHAEECEDPRSILVIEPLRWALALEPEWLAFEQVPPVLELWSMFAQILGLRGYSVWAGVLEAERYGVPQTRERAVLIARRNGAVHPPQPTHQRYVKGEPQRHDITMEGEILPWVSMAQALGWDEGSAAYRLARGEGMEERYGKRRACERPASEPAPTLHFGHALNSVEWVMAKKEDRPECKAQGAGNTPRRVGEPAATLDTRTDLAKWQHAGEPATTIAGDPRVAARGHHDRQMNDAIRVTVEQAAALQTFPSDYPWQGSRTKQFEQIGNAVPPLLAQHILSAVSGAQIIEQETRDAA